MQSHPAAASRETQFSVHDVGGGCLVVNDRGRTVATLSSQGLIDWRLRSPAEPGPRIEHIEKETHLCHVHGLKLEMVLHHPLTRPRSQAGRVEAKGRRVVLETHARSDDGAFASHTVAMLTLDASGEWYEWRFHTTVTCLAEAPRTVGWLEYNNVYPGKAGRGFLFARQKQYQSTLIRDAAGVVWRFPHQHAMHYKVKLQPMRFEAPTWAGFFHEASGNPVIVLERSDVPPAWAICNMFYDLHCGAKNVLFQPSQSVTFEYIIKYLSDAEGKRLLDESRPVEVTDADLAANERVHVDAGLNRMDRVMAITTPSEASGFTPDPPVKVWDGQPGGERSLRITNEHPAETVWQCNPETQIPIRTCLRVAGRIRTRDLVGKGMYLRVRYRVFKRHPARHQHTEQVRISPPVTGTTDGWVEVEVPELVVPPEHFDYYVRFDLVLDGQGVGWLTDLAVNLSEVQAVDPAAAVAGRRE